MPDLKLSDTQLMLLARAAQREDLLLVLPDTLKGGAAKAVVSKLMTHTLVEELSVLPGSPAWRKGEDERPIGLRLTRAGLESIGVEPDEAALPAPAPNEEAVRGAPRSTRAGSKRSLLVSMLAREEGATVDDLVRATGWLPHTTRAALTGLRQRGYTLARDKGEGGRSVYRITGASDPAPIAAQPAHAEA